MKYGFHQKPIVFSLTVSFAAFAFGASVALPATPRPSSGEAQKVVYVVPDLPTFVYYLSKWNGEERFPIFLTRNAYFEKFIEAYKPERLLLAKPVDIGRTDEDLLRAAVCAAWGDETITDFRRGLSRGAFKERLDRAGRPGRSPGAGKVSGIVLTDLETPQLPAALALAAAHGQLLDFLRLPSSVRKAKPTTDLTFEQKEEIRQNVIKMLEQWGYPYKNLGDEVDYITLALDIPLGYAGTDVTTGTKQRLCLDDGINRLTPDGSALSPEAKKTPAADARGSCYAYVGRLLEAEEGMSLYQAMCSIFLGVDSALYFDRWPEKWGLRAQEGWWVMQTRIPTVLVRQSESSLAKWRELVGKQNPFGFVHINSAGGSRQWGDGKVSDIPESAPAIVYFAHSFSAVNPYDETTIAGAWLRRGAYIYFGAISEPFAQSFNVSHTVADAAVNGEPLGKAFLNKEFLHPRFTFPWKQIYIGDPLHRVHFLEVAQASRLQSPNIQREAEPEDRRQFRTAVRMIRDGELGTAIETLEKILEETDDASLRQQVWEVLNNTFRLRFFAIRTQRMPLKSHVHPTFIDHWYNGTFHPNGEPTNGSVMNRRLNLFESELLRLYEGRFRTLENHPRLKEFLAREIAALKEGAAFAKIYLCAGPFSKEDDANPENPFRPEEVLRLDATWQASSGQVGWQVDMVNPGGFFLDLASLFEPTDCVIYAACFPLLERSDKTQATLRVSASDALEVWLNNKRPISLPATGLQPGKEQSAALEIEPGENLLFFKVFRTSERCQLSARLTDATGGYLDGLSYSDAVKKLSASGVPIDPERWRPGKRE